MTRCVGLLPSMIREAIIQSPSKVDYCSIEVLSLDHLHTEHEKKVKITACYTFENENHDFLPSVFLSFFTIFRRLLRFNLLSLR